ncbi:MAG: Mini-ribonuclease 3 [Bacillota bacterium]|jgi:ribonuclease-3 family protein|nr:ribonuclease III [Bacillota bacterium]HOC06823.1 ribonuclease III domain-containing protein [Bacillota bacterium]HPZ22650.1 ribonuclease III domain-containing protein [Bacillota bacterium]HQD19979.1 ribonuclease III domain-containing protein [Bacillota bacterium]
MDFLDPQEASLLPIQHLAWIGDAVYELYSRQRLVVAGETPPGKQVHRISAGFTSAEGQAEAVARLEEFFSQEESDLLRRGRNAKGLPRSSTEYCQATGLEVVVGWLWLSKQYSRLDQLFQMIFSGRE